MTKLRQAPGGGSTHLLSFVVILLWVISLGEHRFAPVVAVLGRRCQQTGLGVSEKLYARIMGAFNWVPGGLMWVRGSYGSE